MVLTAAAVEFVGLFVFVQVGGVGGEWGNFEVLMFQGVDGVDAFAGIEHEEFGEEGEAGGAHARAG